MGVGGVTRHTGTRAPDVLVFAELGIGNIGNEASFAEALRRLGAHLPRAHVRVLSYAPERTAAEHHGEHPRWTVQAISQSADERARSHANLLPGRWATLAHQLGDGVRVARASRGADLVVVPGTGVLEELWTGTWGVPVLLLGAAVGARLHRAPLAVVAVGADLPRRPLTRWMFTTVLRSASVVTFRDDHSLAAGVAMLGPRAARRARERAGRGAASLVSPDLVLGAPGPVDRPAPAPAAPRLVLGVMRYYGRSDDAHDADGAAIHERYLTALLDFARRVLARGWSVDVVVGDSGDLPVAREVVARLGPGARLRPVTTMSELDDVVAGSTAVVASRYHNVVSALLAHVPVVSVSYGAKGDALMAQVGMSGSRQWIEELDADLLLAQLDDVVARSDAIAAQLHDAITTMRAAAEAPWLDIARLVDGATASPGAPHAPTPTALVEESA